MNRQNVVVNLLLAFAAVAVALTFFWLFGGVRWLETTVFPPTRPRSMPQNAIWIDAPALPISWHHGWWFGCVAPSSGTANQCRLVTSNGEEVYAGGYLLCSSKSPLLASEIHLVPHQRMSGCGLPTSVYEVWLRLVRCEAATFSCLPLSLIAATNSKATKGQTTVNAL
jgi:hypothetical protein